MIIVPNNDSHIVHRDRLLIDLTRSMGAGSFIDIVLNNEGPCAQSLGLYDILDHLAKEFDYDKNKIKITTCNLIESHPGYKIVISPQTKYLDSARRFSISNPLQEKTFGDQFKHFGNFIGHGNLQRLHIASYLNQNLKDKTLQSYHYDRRDEYHRIFVGIEDMLFDNYTFQEIEQAVKFLNQCPLKIDVIDSYPILDPATLNITKIYHNFFVEIVNLTYFSGNTFYIDEKIWRPIIMRTPFLIQGPQNYILNLRKLGFRTFDQWWDEGYSEDPGRSQIDGIIANLDRLANYSNQELRDIYRDMESVLEHNYQRLMSIDTREFLDLCHRN